VVRREIVVVPRASYDRAVQSFGHIFAGGYAAGYYSYKWAEVLSADAYSLFEELGVLSAAAGARFRDEVLALGGSRPAMESFVAFRGRPPQLDALLRHNGMVIPASAREEPWHQLWAWALGAWLSLRRARLLAARYPICRSDGRVIYLDQRRRHARTSIETATEPVRPTRR
jgi:hypothetical protein